MALRCTPCKTGKESVYSDVKQENIFCESGNKTPGLCFALRCFSSQQVENRTYWEQLRAGLRRKEKLICASYGTSEVMP